MNAEPAHSSLLCAEVCTRWSEVFVIKMSLPVRSLKAKVVEADGFLPVQKLFKRK